MKQLLLPCPFCDCTDINPSARVGLFRKGPACTGCGVTAQNAEAWNRRTAPAAPATWMEVMEEAATIADKCASDAIAFSDEWLAGKSNDFQRYSEGCANVARVLRWEIARKAEKSRHPFSEVSQ